MRQGALYIIQFVAELINDPDYAIFSQDDILASLDTWRVEATQGNLRGIPRRTSSGIQYAAYASPPRWEYWETDVLIEDVAYTPVAPDVNDYRNGRFEFTLPRSTPRLLISGFSHDPYAAAFSLMTSRAGQLAEDLQSFSTQNGSFTYASKSAGVNAQETKYWAMSRAAYGSIDVVRTDVNIF